MKRLICAILLCVGVAPSSSRAQTLLNASIIETLEFTAGRPLTSSEIRLLEAASETPLGSNVLFCAKLGADLYVGASAAACVDMDLVRYYSLSLGAGIAVGVEFSAFTLVYDSESFQPVQGVYYGGKLTAAMGWLGGTAGVFSRENTENQHHTRDRLFLFGYASGLTLDLAGSVLYIERL